MSLKTFHVVFITVSVLLAFVFGVWCFYESKRVDGAYKFLGIFSFALGIGLIAYAKWFLKKHKNLEPL